MDPEITLETYRSYRSVDCTMLLTCPHWRSLEGGRNARRSFCDAICTEFGVYWLFKAVFEFWIMTMPRVQGPWTLCTLWRCLVSSLSWMLLSLCMQSATSETCMLQATFAWQLHGCKDLKRTRNLQCIDFIGIQLCITLPYLSNEQISSLSDRDLSM